MVSAKQRGSEYRVSMRAIAGVSMERMGVIAVMVAAVAATAQPVEIPVSNRPIQLDGFLMEWSEREARPLVSDSSMLWDAMQTREGIAGYVWAGPRHERELQRLELVREDEVDSITLAVSVRGPSCCPFHEVQWDTTRNEVAVEFLIPWQRLGSSAESGNYRFRLEALDATGEQIGIARFTGPLDPFSSQVFTPRLRVQVAIVAALLAAYLGLMVWVKRSKTPRTKSPHRSA
jgi:hypothetical protein